MADEQTDHDAIAVEQALEAMLRAKRALPPGKVFHPRKTARNVIRQYRGAVFMPAHRERLISQAVSRYKNLLQV